MGTLRSYISPYTLFQDESGSLRIENPDTQIEYLENGQQLYISRANFAHPTKENWFPFIGVGSTKSEAVASMNLLLNKKISAEDHANFLNNNYYF